MVRQTFHPSIDPKRDGVLRRNQNPTNAKECDDDGAQGRQCKAGVGKSDVWSGIRSGWQPILGAWRGQSPSSQKAIGDSGAFYDVRGIVKELGIEQNPDGQGTTIDSIDRPTPFSFGKKEIIQTVNRCWRCIFIRFSRNHHIAIETLVEVAI